MSKVKYDFSYVVNVFNKEGYKVNTLQTDYNNVLTKLDVVCPKGQTFTTNFCNFYNRGHRCKKCTRIGIDKVVAEFNSYEYTVLSSEYNNQYTPIEYICPEGHNGTTTWNNFRSGKRCKKCVKVSYSQVVDDFKSVGYDVISTKEEYDLIGSKFKFKFICGRYHTSSMSYSNFKAGHRCGKCSHNKKKTIEEIRKGFSSRGYILKSSDYVNEDSKLYFVCPNGHNHSITWSNFNKGQNCAKCSSISSRNEKVILDFFVGLDQSVYPNDREMIKPYELDLYFDNKNIAVEYCGLYWHSENAGKKDKYYHKRKYDLTANKGIVLATVFEDEFLNKGLLVLSNLSCLLGTSEKIIGPVDIREVSYKEAVSFYNSYALESVYDFIKSFGLYSNRTLVCCLSFSVVKKTVVIEKVATIPFIKPDDLIEDLFHKLLSYCESNKIRTLTSYCNLRYPNMDLIYKKLGFEVVSTTDSLPNYIVNYNHRFSYSSNLDGLNITDIIWDCGIREYKFLI